MSNEFFEKYKHKIKSIEEVLILLKNQPQRNKTILCHGVFDVVHPGHVRHLAYAKTCAEVLIVSITADKFISKGKYRPHIPERLRALNLAAFEMVDYILIDNNQKPLDLLKKLKPDYFAKGFEYTSSGLPPATEEEANILKAYGGELIFTPGDVVYSSSRFINDSLPQVQIEKLLLLMETHKITFSDLRKCLDEFSNIKIHVVGDTIVDSYTRSTLIGGQTKTPTFSVLYEGKDDYVGGAGVVAKHLRAAGAEVFFSTVLGDDELKDNVINDLVENGIKIMPIIDKTRPTTNKNVIIAENYRLLKIDTVDNRPISTEITKNLISQIKNCKSDIVSFCDFRHGIFNQLTVKKLIDAIPSGTFKAADSQVATRWGNITEFRKFDLLTPNEREARFSLGDQDTTVGSLAGALYENTECKNLLLKLGDRGLFGLASADKNENQTMFSVDSFASNVLDAVGAGDALLAYSVLSLKKTGSLVMAAILGSVAAACECEFDGNVPVKPEHVHSKLTIVEKMAGYNH